MQSWWRAAIVGGVLLVILTAVAVPGLMSSQRASNERAASTTLKTLAAAEADFRANDRDANGVIDFWTGDVAGLYSLKVQNQELKLIERALAESDACPIHGLCWPYRPKAGYFVAALEADDSMQGVSYFLDTGGNRPMGDVHNRDRFGFCAFPESRGEGTYSFIINENNTTYRMNGGAHATRWPDDKLLMSHWSG